MSFFSELEAANISSKVETVGFSLRIHGEVYCGFFLCPGMEWGGFYFLELNLVLQSCINLLT